MKQTTFLLSPLALLLLTACGGGGGGSSSPVTISPEEEATRLLSDDAGDLGTALNATPDAAITARSVGSAAVNLNYQSDTTSQVDEPTVVVSRNASGELTVLINGEPHVFAPGDRFVEQDGTIFGYNVEDPANDRYYSVFSQTSTLDEFLEPGNGWMQVLSYQTNLPGGPENLRGFAVIGTETADAALAGLPTATYTGDGRIDAYPGTGFVDNGTSRATVRGDVTMTANFGAGEIAGAMTGLRLRGAGETTFTDVAGTVTMATAPFLVNGFRGNVSVDDAFTTATGTTLTGGTYSGAFYGTEAQAVGGTMSGTATAEGVSGSFVGFFAGYRN